MFGYTSDFNFKKWLFFREQLYVYLFLPITDIKTLNKEKRLEYCGLNFVKKQNCIS